jgi:hypothetical protein
MVVTNLPLQRDRLCEDLRVPESMLREFPTEAVQVNPELIMEAAPPGSVLILDEVWRLFPAGLKANQVPEPFKTAFAEHRHRVNEKGESSQIVLVCQDLAQISAFARQLVENTFRTTKLTSIGMQKRFRVDVYAGPVSGPNPNTASALRQIPGRYSPDVYKYYESHTQSAAGAGTGADERSIDRRANVLKRPLMIAAPFVIVALVWFGGRQLLRQRSALNEPHSAVGGLVGMVTGRRSSSGAPGVQGPAPSFWRLVAVIEGNVAPGGFAWLSDGGRTVRVPVQFCRRDEGGEWSCPYLGAWYDRTGAAVGSGGISKPVAVYDRHGPVRALGSGAGPELVSQRGSVSGPLQ